MSILQELWYGNINPSEDKEISDGEKKLVERSICNQYLRIKNFMRSRNMLNVLTSALPWLSVRRLKLVSSWRLGY